MLLCPPTNGRGVIPAQGVSVLLGIQLSARVANLLLAAFHANYAVKDEGINTNCIFFSKLTKKNRIDLRGLDGLFHF